MFVLDSKMNKLRSGSFRHKNVEGYDLSITEFLILTNKWRRNISTRFG